MINRLKNFLLDLRDRQRIAIALARGGAMMHARKIRPEDPRTWEFAGFSQNGEDGILDVLRQQLRTSNRYCIEIGAADAIQNNSSWLVIAERYNGLLVEGDPYLSERARRLTMHYSIGAECLSMMVTRANATELVTRAMHRDPDVLSLDIDGIDYYVADAVMRAGLKPKIVVVEYNSTFGPERACTVEYDETFQFRRAHPSHLYYGVSVSGWRKFFARHGLKFVTVDQNGVNAFFADASQFDAGFIDRIKGLEFAENHYQLRKFRANHSEQFKQIASQGLVEIE